MDSGEEKPKRKYTKAKPEDLAKRKRTKKGLIPGWHTRPKTYNKRPTLPDGTKPLSAYQLRTQEEFMKVRPGETQEQWLRRTGKRRAALPEVAAAKAELAEKRKLMIIDAKTRKRNVTWNKYVQNRIFSYVNNREYDFLKYYHVIINHASIKYGISKGDIELCFYFHDHPFFTKEEFEEKTKWFFSDTRGTFRRFLTNNYVVNVNTEKNSVQINMLPDAGFFKLTTSITRILHSIYGNLMLLDKADDNFTPDEVTKDCPEAVKLVDQLHREMAEMIKKVKTRT